MLSFNIANKQLKMLRKIEGEIFDIKNYENLNFFNKILSIINKKLILNKLVKES